MKFHRFWPSLKRLFGYPWKKFFRRPSLHVCTLYNMSDLKKSRPETSQVASVAPRAVKRDQVDSGSTSHVVTRDRGTN